MIACKYVLAPMLVESKTSQMWTRFCCAVSGCCCGREATNAAGWQEQSGKRHPLRRAREQAPWSDIVPLGVTDDEGWGSLLRLHAVRLRCWPARRSDRLATLGAHALLWLARAVAGGVGNPAGARVLRLVQRAVERLSVRFRHRMSQQVSLGRVDNDLQQILPGGGRSCGFELASSRKFLPAILDEKGDVGLGQEAGGATSGRDRAGRSGHRPDRALPLGQQPNTHGGANATWDKTNAHI